MIAYIIMAAAGGVGIGYLLSNRRVAQLEKENARMEAEINAFAKREEMKTSMTMEFENIANRVLKSQTEDINKKSVEQLTNILNPFSQNIAELKSKVEYVYDVDNRERASLGEQLRMLKELNTQLSTEANNLTKALKGNNKTQGNWGEMILERILEGSGLKEGEHFFTQSFIKNKYGEAIINEESKKKMQPDVIVKYPGERDIIIDSKVSLVDFLEYVEAEDNNERKTALKAHVRSVKAHIDELSAKDYSQYDIDSLDFVMLFIPNEAAYLSAIEEDTNLWQYAYDKKVVLMSPTNLISALRLSLDLWKREDQIRGIQDIISRATKLYDKVVSFSESFMKMGERIEQTSREYEKAVKQLSTGTGSVISQAEKLREMGLTPKRKISKKLVENENL